MAQEVADEAAKLCRELQVTAISAAIYALLIGVLSMQAAYNRQEMADVSVSDDPRDIFRSLLLL